ncbi:MAG: macro domain-containing protein [Candidatus Odinarchaeia archaeon]
MSQLTKLSERVYKNVKIYVYQGDIADINADAIVNPANSFLIMGGGVAGALRRKGGESIQKEANKFAPVEIGKAVATTGGNLKARYIIHAPTMKEPAQRTTIENAIKALEAALKCADELDISSVAFPGLGTGVGGLDPDTVAKKMTLKIKSHIDSGTKLKEIYLVGYRKNMVNAFISALTLI